MAGDMIDAVESVQNGLQWLAAADDPDGVNVTAVTKLKHAELWEAAKRLGGQAALARHLEIQNSTIGNWVMLKACPPSTPTQFWPQDRLDKLGDRLFALTGRSLDELFPQSLRDRIEFLQSPKTYEKTIRVRAEALTEYAIATAERLSGSREAISQETEEQAAAISKALKTLSYRERMVIERRYGLNGEPPMSLEEAGKMFQVTKERIRQIEARGLQKLRWQPESLAALASAIPMVEK